jgi:hypothetical protein
MASMRLSPPEEGWAQQVDPGTGSVSDERERVSE